MSPESDSSCSLLSYLPNKMLKCFIDYAHLKDFSKELCRSSPEEKLSIIESFMDLLVKLSDTYVLLGSLVFIMRYEEKLSNRDIL